MHALRLSSFMNRPTLLGLQALMMMELYLISNGRFMDAYTLFGVTIRVAQAVGCESSDIILPSLSSRPKRNANCMTIHR
jgi:hypothetical protein